VQNNVCGWVETLGQGDTCEAPYRDLIPYSKSAAPRHSMSSFVGTDEQPMHTDRAHVPDPPRYVVLQCISRGERACPTYLWTLDSAGLLRDRLLTLSKPQWVVSDGMHSPFYSSIIQASENGITMVRFDPYCMRAASFCSSTVVDAQEILSQYTERVTVDWLDRGILILDNWRCLHARGPGSAESPSRRLRRWYIGENDGLEKCSSI
jgi:alpha-ketoglutarate-dependent taurine dioxygenase